MIIVNNKEERQISLLKYLNKHKSLGVSELAKLLNCSIATVLNDITFLTSTWSDLININIDKKNIATMENTFRGNINKIVSDIIFNSLEIQFIRCLFYHPNQNIYFYAQELYTSPPTLYRVIKRLSKDLKTFGIFIKNQNKTYRIESEDKVNLLLLMTKGLEEFYGLELPKDTSEEEFVEFSLNYQFELPEEQYFLFLIHGIITRNNSIKNSDRMISFIEFYEAYENVAIPEKTENYINAFLSEIGEIYLVPLNAFTKLRDILYYCIKRKHFFTYHDSLFINRHQSFIINFKKTNPLAFKQIEISLKKLLDALDLNFEFYFNYIIFLFLSNCQLYQKNPVKKSIIIYSDLGLHHSRFIKNGIKQVIFDKTIDIQIVEKSFFDSYLYEEETLIISTTFIKKDLPTVYVDDYLTEKNYIRIKRELGILQ